MRILLASASPELAPAVAGVGEVVHVPVDAAPAEVSKGGFDACVLVPASAQDVAAAASIASHGIPVVAVLPYPDAELTRALMKAGATDVLFAPSSEQVAAALRTPRTPAPAPRRSGGPAGIVAVTGPQGGTGRSTVALNLALLLAQRGPSTVVLADLVPNHGILHVLCNLEPAVTLGDVVGPSGIDRDALAQALVPYEEGVRLLAAPPAPEGFTMHERDADDLMDALAQTADYVVADTERILLPHTSAVLERAHVVVCLCRMTVPGLRNLRAYMQSLVRRHIPVQKVLTVGLAHGGISQRQVEEIVGIELAAVLPWDPVAVAAENEGVPVVLGAPRSRLARAIARLADLVVERLQAPGVEAAAGT